MSFTNNCTTNATKCLCFFCTKIRFEKNSWLIFKYLCEDPVDRYIKQQYRSKPMHFVTVFCTCKCEWAVDFAFIRLAYCLHGTFLVCTNKLCVLSIKVRYMFWSFLFLNCWWWLASVPFCLEKKYSTDCVCFDFHWSIRSPIYQNLGA